MASLLATIQALSAGGNVRVSAHGFEELASDDISLAEVLDGLRSATPIEEYPDYHKGPCILLLQTLSDGSAVHVLWGMAKNSSDIATLITAYRPDPSRWTEDFLRRKPK
jgi:hypothetical protein